MRGVVLCGLLLLTSCHSPTDEAIADLRHRVSALEQARAANGGTGSLHYQLVAPSLLAEDHFYASDAECYQAKSRLVADAANQAAAERANLGTPLYSYQRPSSFWQRMTFYRNSGSTTEVHDSAQPIQTTYTGSSTTPFVSCIPVH